MKLNTLKQLSVEPKNLNKLPVPTLVQDSLSPSIYVLFSAQLNFFLKLWV